ncbi:multi-sensor hybrid histidine kinase [Rhodopirellula maiorica SM1]|uniref:Sensory/regulatory protein RpfC n=1 Tax=Rhodopirellula maiorica SM1 TaxID=1265738 RepID=M5RW06_9BACT|nr:ATP-binding protein [Rhodopirellula maiorica]EMI19582.1 multi-sensor hybrid histidine kinase [Rhodopirellula maiorica SM1]
MVTSSTTFSCPAEDPSTQPSSKYNASVRAHFDKHAAAIFRRTDRMFAVLMVLQWIVAIAVACWFSPSTWDGAQRSLHPHMIMAIVGGGVLASLPVAMAIFLPGRTMTRHVIAISQILFSSILIHLSGGRIEMHFHIFGSFAFLASYRDWKVLVAPTVIVAADHMVRGIWWPQSVFGIPTASHWIWIEHTIWVLFEESVLLITIRQSVSEMRSLAVHTVQLEDATQKADDANKAKSEFLASMSHELRTPLNGVIGMTELLAESKLNDRQQRFVHACQSSGKSLLKLISDILDYSKIEAGCMKLEQRPFDLRQLLDDVILSMPIRLDGKSIKLTSHLDDVPPHEVVGDSHRLRQVLLNLLGNAIKFTEQGEIRLVVHPQRLEADEVVLLFSIEDTGIGIPSDRLESLFESFSQVDSSISRKYGGTGLGLSIGKSIVEKMNGVIGVESEEGVGSRFWFTATFRYAADSSEPPEADPPTADIANSETTNPNPETEVYEYSASSSPRILLADDNCVNQQVAREIVIGCGWQCDVVDSGIDALRALASQRYDVVLMDCRMPLMDGFMTTKEIHKRIADGRIHSRPAIVALTANAVHGDRARCLDAGMDDYVNKPFESTQLKQAVSRLLPSQHC